MKYSKRYICLTIILLLVVALKFNRNGSEQVETFRGAQMEPKVWNPLIAESVNENPLSLVVDNRIYSNEDYDIYMNRKLDIMIPVSLVRDSFNCSAGLYDKEKLVVEKHEESADFSLEDKQLTKKNDNYYVSASKLSKSLSYDYSWDIEKNTASAADVSGATSIYPSKYDLREKGRATTVKNQGSLGTCWASASVSALETALLPEESVQFSVDHMTLKNSFAQAQNDGGEYTMGMAYLTAWQGPVYEADDPYGDGESPDGLKPVKHVQEIQVIEGKDFEKIKEAVFKYGGVQTSIYSALRSSQSQSEFYNSSKNAYCYIGTENQTMMLSSLDGMIIIPRRIFQRQSKETEHLSVRIAGAEVLAITEYFIFLIMIRISVYIMSCIPALRVRRITTASTSQICAAG